MFWKKKSRTNSNITLEISDQDGKKRKLDVPKEKLDEWFKTGQVKPKHVYKVLVRGPWEGIKEDYRDIDEKNLKFVDNDTAHAICQYENGVPLYSYVDKKFWDHYDEIFEIMSNPGYTKEQKGLKVKKILE